MLTQIRRNLNKTAADLRPHWLHFNLYYIIFKRTLGTTGMLLSLRTTVLTQIRRRLNEAAADLRRHCIKKPWIEKENINNYKSAIKVLPKYHKYITTSLQNSADPDQTPPKRGCSWSPTSLFTNTFIWKGSNNYLSAYTCILLSPSETVLTHIRRRLNEAASDLRRQCLSNWRL